MWQWLVRLYHRLGSPKWFYEISEKWLPWLAISAAALCAMGLVLGLFFAPVDYQQGNSYRIVFIHVPAAIIAQSAYVMMAVAGAIYLIWKMKMAAWVAKVLAPVGASFCLIALFTGAIWGKPTWGTWWIWDARLTSMLLLLFLYFGAIAISQAMDNEETGFKASAILALVGLVNIPIIKYSVEWWNTLHQGSTIRITEESTMAPSMLLPLLLMIIGSYVLFMLLVVLRVRNEILWYERKSKWLVEWSAKK